MKISGDPNFSVLMPLQCQANCEFCDWDYEGYGIGFLDSLTHNLGLLGPEYKRCTITGGEPTMNKMLLSKTIQILRGSREWDATVLNTNGYNMLLLDGLDVDHINLSRHSTSDNANRYIFQTQYVPSTSRITVMISRLNKQGIDVTINCVLVDQFTQSDQLIDFVEWAKLVGASAVTFRSDHRLNSLKPPKEMGWIKSRTKTRWSCDACCVWSQLVSGIPVYWKSSIKEPSTVHDETYELIMQPNGKLTTDWAGYNTFSPEEKESKQERTVISGSPWCGSRWYGRC